MDIQNNQPEEKKEILESAPQQENIEQGTTETVETPAEQAPEENVETLRQQIEASEVDDHVKLQAQSQAQDLQLLDEEKKLKKLLELATAKGVVYAVAVAKKMNDAYLLDKLHDTLVKEGLYKNFKQWVYSLF